MGKLRCMYMALCVCGIGMCVITTEQDDKVVCQSDIGHALPSAERPPRAR
jgi:hypothetical protein